MTGWHTKLEEKSKAYRDWHSSKISQVIHWTVFLATLATLFLVVSANIDSSAFTEEELSTTSEAREQVLIATNEILVEWEDPGEIGRANNSATPRGKAMGLVNAKVTNKPENDRLKKIGIEVIEVDKQADAEEVAKSLKGQRGVRSAGVNYNIRPALNPNDSLYQLEQWALPKISAPVAWDEHTGPNNVVIAIIDTGVDSTHPDLVGNIVPGWNIYDNNDNTADVYGHGTGVAGQAAAVTNNSTGVASPCWGACKIMPIRATDANGGGTYARLASSIVYAADNGAKIANLSWAPLNNSTAINNAADYMISKGGIVVIATGNNGSAASDLTQDNPRLIAVGSTSKSDTISTFSNYGPGVDVAAPGETIKTTMLGGRYGSGTGTSASAPIVAGVAGLALSANPNLSPAQLQGIIKSAVDDLGAPGYDVYFGHGRINACKAVAFATGKTLSCGGGSTPPADTTPPTVSLTAPTNGATVSGTVNVTASATDNVGVARVEFTIDNVVVSSDYSSPYSYAWNSLNSPNGSHTIIATAFDTSGNNTASNPVTVTSNNATDTTAPTVTITSPNNGGTISGFITFKATATDGTGTGVKNMDLFAGDALIKHCDLTTECSTTFDSTKWPNGSLVFSAKATDHAGNTGTSANVTVTVSNGTSGGPDTTSPTISNISPADGSTIGNNGKTQLKATATDNIKMKQVSIKVNGLTVKTCNASNKTTTTLSCTSSLDNRSQPTGQILVEFIALDVAGNIATKQITLNKP